MQNIPQPNSGVKKCHYCAETVKQEASVCPYCRKNIFSSNPQANAILYIVYFLIAFFIIHTFVDYQSNHEYEKIKQQSEQEYEKIKQQSEQDTQKLMQDIERHNNQ